MAKNTSPKTESEIKGGGSEINPESKDSQMESAELLSRWAEESTQLNKEWEKEAKELNERWKRESDELNKRWQEELNSKQ